MTYRYTWILAVALMLSSCGPGVDEDASGEEIYLQVCARCHADNMSGGLGPALIGIDSPSLAKPEEFFVQTVTSGLGRMPSFGGTLSDAQIQRVVDYVMDRQGR